MPGDVVVSGVWVWLGGTQCCCWFETFLLLAVPVGWVVVGGLARCWVLRRHLRVQGFLGAASGLGRLTHPSLCGVGVVVAGGWGVVVC